MKKMVGRTRNVRQKITEQKKGDNKKQQKQQKGKQERRNRRRTKDRKVRMEREKEQAKGIIKNGKYGTEEKETEGKAREAENETKDRVASTRK